MSTNVKWRMHKAAALLLEGYSSKEVANQLKARPETLSRWKKSPVFLKEFERLKQEVREEMELKLMQLAISTFHRLSEDLMDGVEDEERYQHALQFFKTIGIEHIFAPKPAGNIS